MNDFTDVLQIYFFNNLISMTIFGAVMFSIWLFFEVFEEETKSIGTVTEYILMGLFFIASDGCCALGMYATYEDLCSRAELNKYSHIPMYIYIVFTFFLLFIILYIILWNIEEKHVEKIKDIVQKINKHIFKTGITLFTVTGAICTIIAYIVGIRVVSKYNLSTLFLIPDKAKTIYGILVCAGLLTSTIGFSLWARYVAKKRLFSLNKETTKVYNFASLCLNIFFGLAPLAITYFMVFTITSQPWWRLNRNIMFWISLILIVAISLASLILFFIYYMDNSTHKKSCLLLYMVSYVFIFIISIGIMAPSVFSAYSGVSEYEYITTKEHGDCVVLIRNDTQYVMEAFDYDEATGHLTVYAGEYYVQDLSDVTIRKITFESEDIVNTIKPQDDKKE